MEFKNKYSDAHTSLSSIHKNDLDDRKGLNVHYRQMEIG